LFRAANKRDRRPVLRRAMGQILSQPEVNEVVLVPPLFERDHKVGRGIGVLIFRSVSSATNFHTLMAAGAWPAGAVKDGKVLLRLPVLQGAAQVALQ